MDTDQKCFAYNNVKRKSWLPIMQELILQIKVEKKAEVLGRKGKTCSVTEKMLYRPQHLLIIANNAKIWLKSIQDRCQGYNIAIPR